MKITLKINYEFQRLEKKGKENLWYLNERVMKSDKIDKHGNITVKSA